LGLLAPTISVSAAGDESIDIPLEALNDNNTIRIEGLIGTQTLEFLLPKNWKVNEQSWLDLSVTASDLLAATDSSITISVNGLQITSIPLGDLVGSGRRIPLPSDFLLEGVNTLSFDGMLYLPDDLQTNCKGWDDPSRWMYFNPNSVLHIGFQRQPLPADLSNFPDIFLQPLEKYNNDSGNQTLFVIPDNLQLDDLNALSTTAFFLGNQAGEKFPWNPRVISQSSFEKLESVNQDIIFINNIPSQFKDAIATEKNAIGIFSSPWNINRTVMIIHDHDRQDGYTPAVIFRDWIKKVLLSGNVAYFDKTAENIPPAFKTKYSFEELGYLDRTVRGIGIGNLTYKVYIPYLVEPSSADLALQISHSPDLDDQTSSISVNLNGFTVASILPAARNSRLEPIRVDLPTKRFHPGVNYIRISFDMHLPYSSCEKAPETVWATVFNSSTFQLTYKNRTSIPNLQDFPSPFNDSPSATIVVPDNPELSTLEQVLRFDFYLGASSFYPSQPPGLITTTEYKTDSTRSGNFILVGLPAENVSIRDVNEYLPQPFQKDSNQLQSGYGVYLPTSNTNASIGMLQITPSPWNEDSVILVLTGTDQQGLDRAWKAILDPTVRDQLSGNIMVVGPSEEATASMDAKLPANVHFQQTTVVTKIPLIGRYLQQNGQNEALLSLLAIVVVGLITLIAVKAAPILMRIEVKLRHHPDQSEKEQE
jgi:hypothetical protein